MQVRNLSFWAFRALTDSPRHPAARGRHQIWHLLTLPWLPSPLPLPQRATAPLGSGTWEAAVAAESTGPLVHAVDSTRCPPGPALAGTWGLQEPHLTSSVIWPPKVTHVPRRRHMGSSQRTSPGSLPLPPAPPPPPRGGPSSGCRAWLSHRPPCHSALWGARPWHAGTPGLLGKSPSLGDTEWETGCAWSRQLAAGLWSACWGAS